MASRTLLGPTTNVRSIDVQDAGTLTVELPIQQYGYMIYRLTIAGPVSSIARVFIGNVANYSYRSVSYFGQEDDADYPAGMFVPQMTPLVVAWYSVLAPASLTAPVNITTAAAGSATALAEIEAVS